MSVWIKSSGILYLAVFLSGCTSFIPLNPSIHHPAKSFPELTKRNKLIGRLSPERECYDVLHYSINMTIYPESKSLSGYVDIKAMAVDSFTTLQIDLASNMKLKDVKYQDKSLQTQRVEDAVFIEFPQISLGEEFSFRVFYSGIPASAKRPPWDGGFVWENDELGRPFISVACEGDGASLWWPCKDHISDEPDEGAIMKFTVPENLFCVSNGQLIGINEKDNSAQKTYTWQVKNPINTYNISVQLGHYVSIQDTLKRDGEIHTLKHYVLDHHAEVARKHFKQAGEVIHFFEKYFGPYSWWKDGYKLVEVSYLGMEHQSAIAYGNHFSNWGKNRSWTKDFYGIVDGLLFHETAHEWWGNSVTARDPAHIWIHEGLAVYSEVLYIEEKLGYNVSVDFLIRKRRSIQDNLPIVGPENENYWAFGDSYNKGAWVMHTLRSVVDNDSLWFGLLKTFFNRYAKGFAHTDDFTDLVNELTGENFDYFFNQYMYDNRQPVLEYYQSDGELFHRWNNVISEFNMPIDIIINGKEVRLYPSTNIQKIPIAKGAVIHIKDWEFYIKPKAEHQLIG